MWWAFYVVVNGNSYGSGEYWPWLVLELCVLPIKLSFTYFVVYYLLPRYSKKKRYVSLFLITIGLAMVGGVLIRVLDFYYVSTYLIPSAKYLYKIDDSQFLTFKLAYKVLDLLFVVSLVITIKFVQQQITHERYTKDLLTRKLKTELQFLKHQLQPHFLFNTLNNLYGMILTKDEKAGEVVIKLSEIMNYMLYESNDTLIPLDKELANLTNYIHLERIRYGEELEMRYEMKGETKDVKIPPLILISFVENAFKHGPLADSDISWIHITGKVLEDSFHFAVENSLGSNKKGENPKKPEINSGIGLLNVRKRLELIYGDGYILNIDPSDTYKVELEIPHS